VRIAAGAALLLVAASALSGCGDDGDSTASASCKARVENAAQAAVLAKAFARGDLGTRAEVQSHFTRRDRLFDAQGHMLPYSKLHGLTRGRFDDYRASDAIPGEVQHELADAREQVREQGYPGC
jgi:hypothetical protein